MIKIIRERELIKSVSHRLSFEYDDMPGAGFEFDCDKDGNVLPLKSEAAQENLAMCLKGEVRGRKISPKGVETFRSSYVEPAVGRCSCGREVFLDGFTNTCECGLEYNSSGQELAPRSQWGWETGESPIDIAMIR